jgi:hypothetical protein
VLGAFAFCASSRLATVAITVSAAVLAWATWVDSQYGLEAVQFGIYQSWWFATLIALLGLNVLAAALIRFPWKRRQIGFVIVHAGILVLLVGCWVSRQSGIDAQLAVFEGQRSSTAVEDSQHFELTIHPQNSADAAAVQTFVLPFQPGPFNWDDYAALGWFPWRLAQHDGGMLFDADGIQLEVLDYYSDSRETAVEGSPGEVRVEPVPFVPAEKSRRPKQPRARVRLAVDGKAEEFWLGDALFGSSERSPKIVKGDSRGVMVKLVRDQIDLGFQVALREFQRKLDPGTSRPSYYASRVDFLDAAGKPLAENVLIELNHPIPFTNPTTGRAFRLFQSSFGGPYRPGDREFEHIVAGRENRDQLFQSIFTAAYDPGRELKYAGCLMIIAGIAVMYYMKAYFFRRKEAR